jgi:hypothetical protein
MVFPIRLAGPEEMIIRAAFLLALPTPAVFFEVIDRQRIRIPVVEVLDFSFDVRKERRVCPSRHSISDGPSQRTVF